MASAGKISSRRSIFIVSSIVLVESILAVTLRFVEYALQHREWIAHDAALRAKAEIGQALSCHANLPPIVGAQAPVKLPGAPFLLASALLVLALVIAARTLGISRVAARLD
jgi:hypothetical protein